MSYLGTISHLMEGSGLSEFMSLIQATDTVLHMRSGKSISRDIRGHLGDSDLLIVKTAVALSINSPFTVVSD